MRGAAVVEQASASQGVAQRANTVRRGQTGGSSPLAQPGHSPCAQRLTLQPARGCGAAGSSGDGVPGLPTPGNLICWQSWWAGPMAHKPRQMLSSAPGSSLPALDYQLTDRAWQTSHQRGWERAAWTLPSVEPCRRPPPPCEEPSGACGAGAGLHGVPSRAGSCRGSSTGKDQSGTSAPQYRPWASAKSCRASPAAPGPSSCRLRRCAQPILSGSGHQGPAAPHASSLPIPRCPEETALPGERAAELALWGEGGGGREGFALEAAVGTRS